MGWTSRTSFESSLCEDRGLPLAWPLHLDRLSDLVKDPAVIIAKAPAPGWFDEGVTRGYWGQAAEKAIRAITGGTAKRFSLGTAAIPSFRILDDFVDSGRAKVANEVKTGDGRLTSFVKRQIAKDKWLVDNGRVTDYTRNFFPSARSNLVGPDPALLAELKENGMMVKVWLP